MEKLTGLFISLCFFLPFSLAQDNDIIIGPKTKTRAVIIGVSEYQSDAINDLNYAHKDALAFASFLESKSGGNLKKDLDYKILTNDQATTAKMTMALNWLRQSSKPKDKAIIYFSGHGSVESESGGKLGFLLTYDSPPKVYVAGAMPVFYLQTVVRSMSGSDVEVILITDACRAGKLSGDEMEGTQMNSTILSQRLANEIKILSCQTNELSLEGKWGGGRGLFSYYLIQGLYGMADINDNGEVTLHELNLYLQSTVPLAASPKDQFPKTDAVNIKTVISKVDKEMVAKLKESDGSQPIASVDTDDKGMGHHEVEKVSQQVKQHYDQFMDALRAGQLLYPEGNSAYYYYKLIIEESAAADLAKNVGHDLVAAMQEESQQLINANLESKFFYGDDLQGNIDRVILYSRYMKIATEIIGNDDFFYNSMKAKELYFKALALALESALYEEFAEVNKGEDFSEGANQNLQGFSETFYDSLVNESIKYNLEALKYNDHAANIYNDLGIAYSAIDEDETAIKYLKKALEYAPKWQICLANLYQSYVYLDRHEEAEEIKTKILELDSDNPWIYYQFGEMFYQEQNFTEAIPMYHKALVLEKENYFAHNALGNCYYYGLNQADQALPYYEVALQLSPAAYWPSYNLGWLYYNKLEYDKAENVLLAAINEHENKGLFQQCLGSVYYAQLRHQEAITMYTSSLEFDPYNAGTMNSIGLCYKFGLRNYEMAEKFWREALNYDLAGYWPSYNLGYMYNEQQRFDEAIPILSEAIQRHDYKCELQRTLGWSYIGRGDYASAKTTFEEAIRSDPNNSGSFVDMACLNALENKIEESLNWLEVAFNKGFKNLNWLENNTTLELMRNTPRYLELKQQYFSGF